MAASSFCRTVLADKCRGGEWLVQLRREERLAGNSVSAASCQGMISTLESMVSPSCGNARLLISRAGVPESLIGPEPWVAGNCPLFSVLGVGRHAAEAASRSACRLNAAPWPANVIGHRVRKIPCTRARHRSPDQAEADDRRSPKCVRFNGRPRCGVARFTQSNIHRVSHLRSRRIDSRRQSHW